MALSLYRKYRPEVFSDVVGQEHVEKTLINAISEGSVAHAYLFCGPRGTGKTTTARLLAKALLCESGGAQPDGTCPQCLEIAQSTHPDVFELDAASRTGVDNVREEIIGRVGFAPTRGRFKVYIIDEVHMLSNAAFNALLKTLEEPPEHVVFVLCTTDPHKVPETIQSRCQRFDFRRFSIEEIMGYLERISKGEGFEYEPEALEFIAAKSAGGMRDATTALEQVAVYTEGKITLDEATRMFGQIDVAALFEIAGYIARRDTPSCFVWINDLVGRGVDLSQFARDLAAHLRNLYVTAITGGENGIVACTAAQLERYRQQAAEFGGVDRLARALDICGALVSELRNSSDARLSVEIAMTRLTRPDSELTLEALAERIEALELRPSMGAGAQPAFEPAVQAQAQPEPQPAVVDDTPPWEDAAPAPESMPEPALQANDMASPSVISGEANEVSAVEKSQPEPFVGSDGGDFSTPSPSGGSGRNDNIVASGAMSPERLLAALLSVVRREDAATGALLSGVSLAEEDGQYHLLFPTGSDFQMRIVNGPDAKAIINKAFAEVLGHEAHFDCRIGSFTGLSAQPAPLTSEPPMSAADDVRIDDGYTPVDDGYFESLVAEQSAVSSDEMPADFADALSAFGAGVKVHEINDEE
ncbi:MAG: DNA polymerase III subunit gamma/tau [Coriobacteriales bacterium]